jgi:hypothetical protein
LENAWNLNLVKGSFFPRVNILNIDVAGRDHLHIL